MNADPDMLEVGNGGMTTEEYRSHFSVWALMKVRVHPFDEKPSLSLYVVFDHSNQGNLPVDNSTDFPTDQMNFIRHHFLSVMMCATSHQRFLISLETRKL